MILVVTVSQLKTSVPCDRIMQENEDMECVVAVNERKIKSNNNNKKNTKKYLYTNWISQPYSNKKKTREDLKINKIKKYITHNALI